MLKEERQNFILHEVNVHNKVLTTYLVEKLGVSEDTIRRDLNELAEAGRIIKVHGGALSRSFHNSFNSTDIYSLAEKKAIARKAVHLIQDGMFVFTTGGTTSGRWTMPSSRRRPGKGTRARIHARMKAIGSVPATATMLTLRERRMISSSAGVTIIGG